MQFDWFDFKSNQLNCIILSPTQMSTRAPDKMHKINFNQHHLRYSFKKSYPLPLVRIILTMIDHFINRLDETILMSGQTKDLVQK